MLKRTPQDRLEDESVSAVHSLFNSHGWEFNRQARDKSGIDGEIEIVHGVERSGRFLKCQIKAGTSYVSSETEVNLKIRLERKYLEHWAKMTVPVLLFFYHPDTRSIYWKAIKEYLKLYPALLTHSAESCLVTFDKESEGLTGESLSTLEVVETGSFAYEHMAIAPKSVELGWSNWFPVKSFPTLWGANTDVGSRSAVIPYLSREHTFTIHGNRLLTFSDMQKPDAELRSFFQPESLKPVSIDDVPSQVVVELLNQSCFLLAKKKSLAYQSGRFYFSSEVLKSTDLNQFSYSSLKGREETRTKIYILKIGTRVEYKHHAVRLTFLEHSKNWYLQLDPDWHFSYPFGKRPAKGEIGARITSEKASTHNKDYLYLLHFWRQFLAGGKDTISIPCSRPDDASSVEVVSLPLEFKFRFRLLNDYVGPKDKSTRS
jgi:Domain of unknown function (DUF4365)